MGALGWRICVPFIALLLLPLAQVSACPEQCYTCTTSKLACPRFTAERRGVHLEVRCTDWRPYDFGDMMNATTVIKLGHYKQLTFANCAIPRNRSLADTLAFLGPLSHVSTLFFLGNSKHTHSAPLEPILFETLDFLGTLSLKNATRHPITTPDLFVHLAQLHWLDLREYSGDSLPVGLLQPLKALRTLEYSLNLHIKQLPAGWFSNLPNLESVTIFGNGLTSVPRFQGTPLVKLLDLSGNMLETLPENMFTEVPQLVSLYLNRNRLTTLPDAIFSGLINLTTLNLADNGLQQLPNTLLQDQVQLRQLKLSNNNLSSLNTQALQNLNRLEELYLDRNQLRAIDVNAFAGPANTLKELALEHNHISLRERDGDVMYVDGTAVWGLRTPFHLLNNVTKLNLAHNAIDKVFDDFKHFMPKLVTLNLSCNSITRLAYEQLHFVSKNVEVLDLSGNQIQDVQVSAASTFETESIHHGKLPEKIVLGDNPLRCDCKVHAFVSLIQKLSATLSPFAVDRLLCESPAALHQTPVSQVPLMELVCDSDGDVCPPECGCQIRPEDRVVVVDCASHNLTSMPQLQSPAIIGYRAVDLRLQDNLLETVDPASFGNESSVTAWQTVYRLNVSNNRLTTLASASLPPALEMLDVSGNRLEAIDGRLSRYLKRLQSVGLARNPWACKCSADVLQFVQANFSMITDIETMRCSDRQNITVNLHSELCSVQLNPIIWISVTVALVALLVALLGFLYQKYTYELKVWLFTHNLLHWWTNEEELDKDKLYDAFVSYSHKDEQFITEHLVPTLEHAPMNFRICWHVRDFMPGELISTQITKAVEESRRTIIVLSANYLESVWGQMEFKTAYLQSIEDKRNRVIAIIYGDIGDIENLDQELRAYLKTNTYLRCDDPWFWDKLRYAMPHTRMAKGEQIANNMRMASMDKLNLIKPTQNGGTTGLVDGGGTEESTPPIQQLTEKGTDSTEGPLTKLYAPSTTAPLFTISNIQLD